jgi:hypothetical protein
MSHQKAKLLHVEKSLYGLDWCRELYYKILMNPMTFAKMLVKKNLDDVELIQCVEYIKDEYGGDWKSEWGRIKRDEFLKLKYRRKERKEYIIHFTGFNVAVIRCWRREADIVEVSL